MSPFTKQSHKKLLFLPIDELVPNALQPRKQFDDASLLSLSESIRLHGMLQPITVRAADPAPYPNNVRGASYEIISGERRWRAAKLAGIQTVPCIFREADRTDSAELALVENGQREDLDFFEEADAIRNLLLLSSMSQNEIARRLSVSPSALSNKLRLLKLTPEERSLIRQGGLGERHARAFLRIKDETKRKSFIQKVIRDSLSAAKTEELVEKTEQAPQVREQKKKRISLVRDVRFFFNTFDRSVALLKEAGFAVREERTESENGVTVTLFVPNKRF